MRVLLITAGLVGSSDVGFLLAKAFQRAGCEVKLINARDRLPFWAEVGYAHRFGNDPLFRAAFSRYVQQTAKTWQPDLLFMHGSNWGVTTRTLQALKKQGTIVALWELNQLLWWKHQSENIRHYDHFFALDSYLIPLLKSAKANKIWHLPACADPDEHSAVPLSDDEKAWYGADICFIGTAHDERIRLLGQLTHHDLRVYGRGWEKAGPDMMPYIRNEPIYGLKKTKVYTASKASLNVHGPHMVHGENFRVYEVALAGGASFSAYKPDLVQSLQPESEFILFEDAADLRKKADYFLTHQDELNEIAANGRQRVLREHTYDCRVQTILERVKAG